MGHLAQSPALSEPVQTPVAVLGNHHPFPTHHLRVVVTAMRHPTREELIREAAYHRAEARDFAAGHELEDWLAAEVEVSARMNGEGRAY